MEKTTIKTTFHTEVSSLKCYIYKIINNVTGEKYVGQTTNFSRRISDHISKLKLNKHPNPKLQASWNKYGENSFSIEKTLYNLTKQELDKKEIEEIKKEDSFKNGFNLTLGGTGGDTRSKIKLEDFYEIYLGNLKYDGLTTRTASFYNCDSSTVSSIKREIAYDSFREKTKQLSLEEKNFYLSQFEKKIMLDKNPPRLKRKKLDNEDIIIFLSLLSCYGRGIEAAYIRFNNLSKGLGNHIKKGQYKEAQSLFKQKTDDEILKIAKKYFEENSLQNYCVQKIKLKEEVRRPL